ncbi:MAG TPA: hypothetical protein VMF66_06335 [Candidatus Acidoferrum sp.]|nr:hypothetical protein [Candidatus Acidoferrum sp.]
MSDLERDRLVGLWKLDPEDAAGRRAFGDITLRFDSDGTLLYTIHLPGRDQVMRLIFQMESGFIVTDQPSHPRRERTRYEFKNDGRLVLTFEGNEATYIRIP